MMHKYFVTQGTKILFEFLSVWRLGKNQQWQGGVHCGEVSKMGRGLGFEVKRQTLCLCICRVILLQPGSVCVCVCAHACACVSVERLGPQGKSGHRAQASLMQGECRAGCGERDQARGVLSARTCCYGDTV
jgi:hypothetical protein